MVIRTCDRCNKSVPAKYPIQLTIGVKNSLGIELWDVCKSCADAVRRVLERV